MKYMIMFCGTDDDARHWEGMSDQERGQAYARVGEWFTRYAGKLTGDQQQLQVPSAAKTVRFPVAGAGWSLDGPVVTDGPFAEAKESIGGYAVVDVASIEEAIDMAKTWPASRMVEVRPILEMR